MPLRGFQKQFVQGVENGLDLIAGIPLRHPGVPPKTQTIRAYRKDKRDAKVGDDLHLYTGGYDKSRRKVGEAVCSSADNLFLYANGRGACRIAMAGIAVPVDQIDGFSRADGFETPKAMIDWFKQTHGLPFEGLLIRWGEIEHG